jgi:hypothetical protein
MTQPRTIITHGARIATLQHAVGFPEARLVLQSSAKLRHDVEAKMRSSENPPISA